MRALPVLDAPASARPPGGNPKASEGHLMARSARRSAVERLAADRAKYVRSTPASGRGSDSEVSCQEAPGGQHSNPVPSTLAPAPVARRAIARKPLRPDSLVIYRQKCEFVRGPGADCARGGLVKKLFQGPGKEKVPAASETPGVPGEHKATEAEAAPTKPGQRAAACPASPVLAVEPKPPAGLLEVDPKVPVASTGVELRKSRRGGLQRSQSDLSSRYSVARAEVDSFFHFCGLDPEVVEALGRENFSAASDHVALKVRSVSVATSDSGFSHHSEDGLQEEELTEQVPSTTSVVERNARIIKWLFNCKKAKETPNQRLQGPA
ncbi:protein FAM110C [Nannospalax galili]|uniref:Family with sequence similarity 110, member C n=1 Tax=Nannospalax galili TaxID=1026970 RepID=A0A8C6R7Z8_NANGA|nr:protein FAM110C [Nannospalax galili]